MQTTEALRRQIKNAEDLLAVVKTMKTLAAVNIRQYELAVESLAEYNRTVEMGLHILLSTQNGRTITSKDATPGKLGVILFGSDQGLCGAFNERVARFAVQRIAAMPCVVSDCAVIAIGMRAAAALEEADPHFAEQGLVHMVATPGGTVGITSLVQDLLLSVEKWRLREHVDRIVLFHNRPQGAAAFVPHIYQLLPIDLDWLRRLENSSWPSHVLPTFTMGWDRLFAALIRQHMFVTLFRACAESLASENASRLVSMQNAERNIEERLRDLDHRYHALRQTLVTAELLDIISGYEAVTAIPA